MDIMRWGVANNLIFGDDFEVAFDRFFETKFKPKELFLQSERMFLCAISHKISFL